MAYLNTVLDKSLAVGNERDKFMTKQVDLMGKTLSISDISNIYFGSCLQSKKVCDKAQKDKR